MVGAQQGQPVWILKNPIGIIPDPNARDLLGHHTVAMAKQSAPCHGRDLARHTRAMIRLLLLAPSLRSGPARCGYLVSKVIRCNRTSTTKLRSARFVLADISQVERRARVYLSLSMTTAANSKAIAVPPSVGSMR